MAYSSIPQYTPPSLPSDKRDSSALNGGGKPLKGPPVSFIIDENNPIASPVGGEIKFQKSIYSQGSFRKRVDVSFNELTPKIEEVDIPGFFNQYRRLFFDISKEGELSHSTLIQDSGDFVRDFSDPKDEIINNLESQIISLNQQIIDIQTSAIESNNDDLQGVIDSQSDQIEIGNPNDPNISWGDTDSRKGLEFRSEQAFSAEQTPNGTHLENGNMNGPRRDLKQAFERGGSRGIRAYQEIRTYSEWKQDIEHRSSGKDLRDLFMILDYIKDTI